MDSDSLEPLLINKTMNDKEILKLLKSGKFTLITWDNWSYTIYPQRFLEVEDDIIQNNKIEWFPIEWHHWYMPRLVQLLAEALGGSTDSI